MLLTRDHAEAEVYFMAMGAPVVLDEDKVELMIGLLKARTSDAAHEALVKLGFVQDGHL